MTETKTESLQVVIEDAISYLVKAIVRLEDVTKYDIDDMEEQFVSVMDSISHINETIRNLRGR